jgi:hypothetical protein
LEFALCSAALLSPLDASTNNMRMQILRTMWTTTHLPNGMNPYNRAHPLRSKLLEDRSSLCFDVSFALRIPEGLAATHETKQSPVRKDGCNPNGQGPD